MSRYIDVEWLKRFFESDKGKGRITPIDSLLALIVDAPSIDIVCCGECEYKHLYDDGETKYYYCALEDRPNRQWSVDDTDFCSWGERRIENVLE